MYLGASLPLIPKRCVPHIGVHGGRFEDVGGKLSERTDRSSCDVMIFSTPLTRIVTPPNDDEARFRRIAEKIGLRRTKMEGATITLIHQFNVTRANNKSSGMGANPFRTQSITLYMNRRIVRSTPRKQIGDLSKEKDDACTCRNIERYHFIHQW